jgi:hypothetical protein
MSSLLSKIGLGLAALFVLAGVAGLGATTMATADGTPPPPPPPTTNGNPWHD